MVDKKRREGEMEGTEEAAEVMQQSSIIGPFSHGTVSLGIERPQPGMEN